MYQFSGNGDLNFELHLFLLPYFVYASSEGYIETARMCRHV